MKDVWKLPEDEKILVRNNPFGQPTGDGGSKLGKFSGVIARNSRILPLSYETWSKIPKTTKEEAFSVIKGQRIPLVSSYAHTPRQNNDGIGSNIGPHEENLLP